MNIQEEREKVTIEESPKGGSKLEYKLNCPLGQTNPTPSHHTIHIWTDVS